MFQPVDDEPNIGKNYKYEEEVFPVLIQLSRDKVEPAIHHNPRNHQRFLFKLIERFESIFVVWSTSNLEKIPDEAYSNYGESLKIYF